MQLATLFSRDKIALELDALRALRAGRDFGMPKIDKLTKLFEKDTRHEPQQK
jgi:hypothetical protein